MKKENVVAAQERVITERRSRERFDLRIPVRLSTSLTPGPRLLSCKTKNLSEMGASLIVEDILQPGTAVEMLFELASRDGKTMPQEGSEKTIHAKGRVVRKTDEGVAVSFDKGYRVAFATQH